LKNARAGQLRADRFTDSFARKVSVVHVPLAVVTAFGGFAVTALVLALVALLMLGRPGLGRRAPE
jgi:hypothetical protein